MYEAQNNPLKQKVTDSEAAKEVSQDNDKFGNTMSDFARRSPTLAVCGLLLAGITCSRVFKDSGFYTSPAP